MTWIEHEELKAQAAGGKKAVDSFDHDQELLNEVDDTYIEVPLDDSESDNLTAEETALIERGAEIEAVVDTFTQTYPTVSGDV